MSWILTHLYEATKNPEHLIKAIEIWQKEIVSASKRDMVNRVAEFYWEIAKAQDILGGHLEAAENFESASESYMKAAKKFPQLKDFYREYASYMLAWGEFEKAKQYHAEKKYLQAKEHYEKVADIYESTERWNYMAPNYLAWARLEEAEDFSRKEQTEEAIKSFKDAINLFEETKRTIEIKLESIQSRERETMELFEQASDIFEKEKGSIEIKPGTIQDEKEKELLVNLIQASDIRCDYCLGRIALEEATTLDQQGHNVASSRGYGSAAKIFERIAGTSEEASGELQPLICLCKAWQNMSQAEAEASSDLYLKASRLFEEAKDLCTDEKSKRLVLGHSHFCRALEAGIRFEDTRDRSHYSEAIQQLGSAASLYVRAGFKGASEYAKATQRLFEAYVYMDDASKETDPQEKAKYYLMAERLLESSTQSYLTAKYPEKSKEVERLLGRVREESEMAASLSEVLLTPAIVSPAEAFTVPMPTSEKAVGLERFENADIEANLILDVSEVNVGEEVGLEIELTNTGKMPAQLLRVEEIIPDGFTVIRAPEFCRVEGSSLNIRRRTLSPLLMEEVKIVIKPMEKGDFHLEPRILYLDETGSLNSYEPDPATLTVKELGISGWLRGPSRRTQKNK